MKVLAVFLVGAPASDPPLAMFSAVDSEAARREAAAYVEKFCRGKAVDLREIDVPAPPTGTAPS
jgi:hypothetical protein